VYDFPEPAAHSPNRETTTTPLQQLFVLNSPFVQQQSQALAARITATEADDNARVRNLYALLYGRAPSDDEAALVLTALTTSPGGSPAVRWTPLIHVLLGANEFMFVD
jgi:hypothetical protein